MVELSFLGEGGMMMMIILVLRFQGRGRVVTCRSPKRCRHVSKSTAPALVGEELVGALVGVD